jgi:transposase
MIVIGVDAHKRTHTLVALDSVTGAGPGQKTVAASDDGALEGLRFAAGLDRDRVWAVEDCRHVSARLERALLAVGERVIRVPPALTGESRKATRVPGKSDPIDATAVALAAIREGLERLPVAFLDEQAHEIRVLCDYRDQLMGERTRLINRLRWHLVRIAPEIEAQLGPAALKGPRIRARLARQLGQLPASPQLRIAKALLRRINEISREQRELFAELTELLNAHAPQLLEQPSIGPVTAAVIIGRTAGAQRFRSEACFARHTGTAPDPSQLRQHRSPPPAPRRRPTAKPRDPHHRARPRPVRSDHPGLPATQTQRREDQARSDPLSQTPHRPRDLAPPLQRTTTVRDPTLPSPNTHPYRSASAHAVRPITAIANCP